KEAGYQRLIGNVSQLVQFNKLPKGQYELLIPLQFWFNRHVGNALPMLALFNASVTLNIKLRDFGSISYVDPLTTFVKKPRLDCSLLAEYIFIDAEERRQMATSKLEYLIGVLQSNGNLIIGPNQLNTNGVIEVE